MSELLTPVDIEAIIAPQERSEEVADIIEKMPSRFGYIISAIVVGLFLAIAVFGWVIQYPDKVSGPIIINAEKSPVKLVSNTSGKLTQLSFMPKSQVKEGDYIAVVQNAANTRDVREVAAVLLHRQFNEANNESLLLRLPVNLSLGELSTRYFALITSMTELKNFHHNDMYGKQIEGLQSEMALNRSILNKVSAQLKAEQQSEALQRKSFLRDSVLYSHKHLSESEYDRASMSMIGKEEELLNVRKEIDNLEEKISGNTSDLSQAIIQKAEKEQQLSISMTAAYNDLLDNFRQWELKYVLKAPIDGTIEYLNFYQNNDFVQTGQEVFSVIPAQNIAVGQMLLPAQGSGKVKLNQKVIIKLDNYPYAEFGSVEGKVKSISMVSNEVKAPNQKASNTYLVLVALPNKLQTNYGSLLEFKYKLSGNADIVTNERRLILRLFDNLKYIVNR